ncbi:MAG: methyltransferase [Gemmatimonadota bacterium]
MSGSTKDAPSWLDRLHDRWARLLADPAFQRAAAAFPLTRPIAVRRSRRLFDLSAGFVYTQTLLACCELDLFSRLLEGPADADALAAGSGIAVERLRRLLDAAVALKLLRRRADGLYGLGRHGAPLAGNPGLRAMLAHNRLLYEDLRRPIPLLQGADGTDLARYWPYAGRADPTTLNAEDVAAYSGLMAASQEFVAAEVLDLYPFGRHREVLDVGGGEGAFLAAVRARHPGLRLALFDLPAVAERARSRLACPDASCPEVRIAGGDFLTDALPTGADLVTLVRIVHDHDDDAVLTLFRAVRAALAPGGRLLVAEPMSGVSGASTVGPAYFSWYLLAMGTGRPRTPAELARLLRAAGFGQVGRARTRNPVLASVLTASL